MFMKDTMFFFMYFHVSGLISGVRGVVTPADRYRRQYSCTYSTRFARVPFLRYILPAKSDSLISDPFFSARASRNQRHSR